MPSEDNTSTAEHQVNIPLRNVSPKQRSARKSYYREVFDAVDADGNGRITLSELRVALSSGELRPPDRALRHLMQRADIDQNGYLDYKEFERLVSSRDWPDTLQHALNEYVRRVVPPRRRRIDEEVSVPDGEYEQQYTCWPPVLGMFIISTVEIFTFLWDLVGEGKDMGDGTLARALLYTPYHREEAWRFLTYMLVHIGVLHLVVNLLVQLVLGIPLEMVHGWWRVLIVYFAGVVAGSLGTSIADPRVLLAGASGGVYAILLAHIATIIMNWSEMFLPAIQMGVFMLLIVVDVGTAVYNRYFTDEITKVGYVAHLSGAVAGLLLGINVLRNLRVKPWEKKLWWISIAVYIVAMTIAILWNICYPDYWNL